ncbi:hypothetical protein [Microvirga yunnanensis]|uniref:hypothetical protein n=1 Tax=Microvirga yunnanensis TaxID=2953740 RepID=UPI0021C9F529|nr:hypothetical protein [Microvirga sp. HBU65207]
MTTFFSMMALFAVIGVIGLFFRESEESRRDRIRTRQIERNFERRMNKIKNTPVGPIRFSKKRSSGQSKSRR